MFADEFKHEVGRYLENQTEKLFVRQREAAAEAPYYRRTGRLKDALWNLPTANGTKIEITYPLEKPCVRDPRSPSAVDPRKQV